MIGDGPQLLTHYYDDARTMYQVFRRGLSISGERGRGGVQELWQGVSRCKGQQWGGGGQVPGAWEVSGAQVQRRKATVGPSPTQSEK